MLRKLSDNSGTNNLAMAHKSEDGEAWDRDGRAQESRGLADA